MTSFEIFKDIMIDSVILTAFVLIWWAILKK